MTSRARRLRYRWAVTREVAQAPRVDLRISRGRQARYRHRQLTAPHPTLRIVSNGGFGAALLPLPDSMDAYLSGESRKLLRRKRRRASAAGYRFAEFSAPDHVGDILAIHHSMPVRQGQPMLDAYVDEESVAKYAANAKTLHGVLDGDGAVRAYANLEVLGELAMFGRLIGHADDLEEGIVYLLASEAIGDLIAAKRDGGLPRWVMGGSLWGNSEGLAYFKRRVGFRPYRARFILEDPQDPAR